MKRMKSWSLFVGVLFMALLCLTGCSGDDEKHFVEPKSFPKINTGLKEGIAYDIELEGMTGAAMYNGEIYVCNKTTNNVTCYEKDFTPKRTIGKIGSRDGELRSPEGMWVDDEGVHVLDWGNRRIVRFAHDGTFIANYPITGTYKSALTQIGGFCRADGRYWISLSNDFICKVLIVSENRENKLMDVKGLGDFFVKDGVPYLITRYGMFKEGRKRSLYSVEGGEIYQCSDEEIVKVNGGYPAINPLPFVCFGDKYLSISLTVYSVCVYSQENFELLGYAMELEEVGTVKRWDPAHSSALEYIKMLVDDDTLYFLWPTDHKVYTWTRSAT